jgi:hypothetical protein
MDITAQCRTYRSDVQLYGLFRELYLRVQRKQRARSFRSSFAAARHRVL